MTFDAFSRYLALETASRQVCVQPRPLTLYVTLPHLLLSDGACCTAPTARLQLSIDGTDKRTDGWTDARPLHRPCSAYYAGSFNFAAETTCGAALLV